MRGSQAQRELRSSAQRRLYYPARTLGTLNKYKTTPVRVPIILYLSLLHSLLPRFSLNAHFLVFFLQTYILIALLLSFCFPTSRCLCPVYVSFSYIYIYKTISPFTIWTILSVCSFKILSTFSRLSTCYFFLLLFSCVSLSFFCLWLYYFYTG